MNIFDRWMEYVYDNIGGFIGEDIDDAFDELFYSFKEQQTPYLQNFISDDWRFEVIWGDFTKVWEERGGGVNGVRRVKRND